MIQQITDKSTNGLQFRLFRRYISFVSISDSAGLFQLRLVKKGGVSFPSKMVVAALALRVQWIYRCGGHSRAHKLK
jgi:hypothetical protein